MGELQAQAGLDTDDPDDWTGYEVLTDNRVGTAVSHTHDCAVESVSLIERRWRDERWLINRLAWLDRVKNPTRLGCSPDAILQPGIGLCVGHEDPALEVVGNDLLFPCVHPSSVAVATGLWSKGGSGTPSTAHSSLGALVYRR